MTQSELSEFLDAPSTSYHCGFKASDIGQCLYKICDDSVRPRQFLGADNEDEIEATFADREGHSLHEILMVMSHSVLSLTLICHEKYMTALTLNSQVKRYEIYLLVLLQKCV